MKREWLTEYRIAKGLSQHAIAKMCDITPQAYNQYETGKKRPSPETAQKIGKLLGFKWTRFYQ